MCPQGCVVERQVLLEIAPQSLRGDPPCAGPRLVAGDGAEDDRHPRIKILQREIVDVAPDDLLSRFG